MTVETKFDFQDRVYLITDPDQRERIVVGMTIRPNGISYALAFCESESWHYAFEISREKNWNNS